MLGRNARFGPGSLTKYVLKHSQANTIWDLRLSLWASCSVVYGYFTDHSIWKSYEWLKFTAISSREIQIGWFCIVVELYRGGAGTNGATLYSFHCFEFPNHIYLVARSFSCQIYYWEVLSKPMLSCCTECCYGLGLNGGLLCRIC